MLAGLYQFSGFKIRALMKCRSPLSFIMMRWESGNYGAATMGVDYGTFCTKCCWVLMAGLLTVGAMSIPLMGLFSIIIFAEKVGPFGPAISKLVGAAFLGTGILLILYTQNPFSITSSRSFSLLSSPIHPSPHPLSRIL